MILKAEILTHLNKELYRSEADIDEYILEALKDLSLRDDFLWVETTVPTTDGGKYYSVPTDFKGELVIKIDDNEPLYKIPFRTYQTYIADQTATDEAEPYCYAIHGGFWYPYPVPDKIYTVTLHYAAFILEIEGIVKAVDSIVFADIYRNAINTMTKYFYCKSKGMKDEAIAYLTEYIKVILPPLQKLVKRELRSIEYQDL
jgi:hypothetical protein